jgi:hypothetical protein
LWVFVVIVFFNWRLLVDWRLFYFWWQVNKAVASIINPVLVDIYA